MTLPKPFLNRERRQQDAPRTSVEWAEQALSRAVSHPSIMTVTTAGRARRVARQSDLRRGRGSLLRPLDGVPVVVKDLFDLKGLPTTAGAAVPYRALAEHDAEVVAALATAGAVVVGRTSMTELAFSGLGINPHHGTPAIIGRSGTAHVPGGSSSGAAAAVTAGIAPVSIGTDTSGSVRIPAAFHGIFGYKATAGRYPTGGMVPLAPSLDSIGILAADLEHVAVADAVLRGGEAPPPADDGPLTLTVPDSEVTQDVEPAVARHFAAALRKLRDAGIRVTSAGLPEIDEALALTRTQGPLVGMEAWRVHRRFLEENEARMDPRVASRLRQSAGASDAHLAAVQAQRRALARRSQRGFSGNRLVVYPTVACTSPALEPLLRDDDAYVAANARVLRNTMVANLLDWCAVTVPMDVDAEGLWSGLMLCAGRLQDRALLRAAALVVTALMR